MIYLAADHRGFELKEKVKKWLEGENYPVKDLGNSVYNRDDDYPDFVKNVAEKISQKRGRGIIFCGSGIGVDIAANRYIGVRCGLGFSPEQIKHGRENDDINCLSLAVDFFSFDQVKKFIKVFLETKFTGQLHYQRRIKKIDNLRNL